ncbi:hexameric tyrosine-coordinated heme protein [Sphingomonas sp. MM-1]|uniref:hexameric tyrosine-coordinated heme protein n=1 Tax=Sphingomonas sp. MM-1 TaxID=745310 RepID=UPI002E7FCC54|nr:hexameric tyrosine-coordinated heme protein [Sphingomonas sp. MM-1]
MHGFPPSSPQRPRPGSNARPSCPRVGAKVTQPSNEVRQQLRPANDHDTAQLIAGSQVIAINFQTVAAANHYWR